MTRNKIPYRFTALPRVAKHLAGLPSWDVTLYLYLWEAWHNTDDADVVQTKVLTTATLAEEYGLKVRGVQRSINQLVKAGLITIRWARRPLFVIELHTDMGDGEEPKSVVRNDKSDASNDKSDVSTMGSDEA